MTFKNHSGSSTILLADRADAIVIID